MKKIMLSLSVICAFLGYSLFAKKSVSPTVTPTLPSSETPSPSPSQTTTTAPTDVQTNKKYKDGEFTGPVADAFYGNVQVKAIIQNGKITDVQFLDYPNDRSTSIRINTDAMPALTSEAIQAQNAQVDIVSGATDTSKAFIESLQGALSQAAL